MKGKQTFNTKKIRKTCFKKESSAFPLTST